jgi:hypothetical protein
MTDPITSITIEVPTAVAHKLSETGPGTLAETALIALRLYHGIGQPARTTLAEMAEENKLTPAKTLRLAIEQLKKDTTRLHLAPAVGRPIVNTDRDAEIYAKTRTGITHATIAAEYGISIVRIGQIVAKQRALMKTKAPETFKLKTPEATHVDLEPAPEPQPEAPRKLAVIPPSMKNPELLIPKPIKIPDPAKVDVSMFDDDFPL